MKRRYSINSKVKFYNDYKKLKQLKEKAEEELGITMLQDIPYQNQKAVSVLEKMNSTLADAIIEITEPLDILDFQDLEKIARCFESKINQFIKEYGGNDE